MNGRRTLKIIPRILDCPTCHQSTIASARYAPTGRNGSYQIAWTCPWCDTLIDMERYKRP